MWEIPLERMARSMADGREVTEPKRINQRSDSVFRLEVGAVLSRILGFRKMRAIPWFSSMAVKGSLGVKSFIG
jgi:hypothetical protein